jgi:hypothetical protein
MVSFENNLPDRLLSPRLEISLSGRSLDEDSVTAYNDGRYNSRNSNIIWDLTNSRGQEELDPGESGQVSLSFSSLPDFPETSENQDIILNFLLTGVPIGELGQGVVSVSETRTVRISSQINFSSKILYSLGPFANYGPIPPKVGEETTYAVVFNAGNTQNDLTEAKVSARLGPGVTWLGAPSVGGEDITYDSSTNMVSWEIGTLSSGTGFSSAAREAAFQVALTPTASQVGIAPVLVNSIVFSGRDTMTGNIITLNNTALTTRLVSDPIFIQGDDVVVR